MVTLDQVLSQQYDLRPRGRLKLRLVRSEMASGTISTVELADEPHDVRLITAADIPGTNQIQAMGGSMPILASGEVRYIGQPLAVLASLDRRALDEASTDVVVDYERRQPQLELEQFTPDQVVRRREITWGDPETALADAFQVVEGKYRTGIYEELVGLPPIASAEIGDDGRLVLRCATRWPHHVQSTVCGVLDLPKDRCRVITTATGLPLPRGIWQPSHAAALAGLATFLTGEPSYVELTPEEVFRFASKPPQTMFRHTTGLDEHGDPVVADIEVLVNVGAYPMLVEEVVDRVLATALGGYGATHLRARVVAIATNLPPIDVSEALGSAQACFAAELHASRIVEVAQLEPLAWRRRNLLSDRPRILRPDGERPRGGVADLLDTANRLSDYSRKHAAFELQKKRREAFPESTEPTRGVGLSVVGVGAGLVGLHESALKASVKVRLEKEGTATLLTSAVPESLRLLETWRGIVADTLDVAPEKVSIPTADTDHCPDSGPSVLSRNVASITRVIENCCAAVQKKRFRSPLPIEVKRTYRGPRTVGWDDENFTGDPFAAVTWAACVVEVEADPVTLETAVRELWLVIDAGNLLDEARVRESLELGCLRSLFWAGGSTVSYRTGRITSADYLSAHTPEIAAAPRISVRLAGARSRAALKGIGEVPFGCVPAAYIQAVSQATGQYLDRLPSTPRTVFSYLEEE